MCYLGGAFGLPRRGSLRQTGPRRSAQDSENPALNDLRTAARRRPHRSTERGVSEITAIGYEEIHIRVYRRADVDRGGSFILRWARSGAGCDRVLAAAVREMDNRYCAEGARQERSAEVVANSGIG